MQLSHLLLAVAFSAAGALLAALLAPLARIIPLRLQQGWRQEVAEMADDLNRPLTASEFEVSGLWRVSMAVAGGALGVLLAHIYGLTIAAGVFSAYFLGLLLLLVINLKHQLLPDKIVLPLLWAGLVYGALMGQAAEHIYGAAVGYLAPLVLLHVGKASTGKIFIGFGDLKTFAMAGAWFGLGALPVLFGAFVAAVLVAIVASAVRGRSGLLPTGLAHFVASLACVVGTKLP